MRRRQSAQDGSDGARLGASPGARPAVRNGHERIAEDALDAEAGALEQRAERTLGETVTVGEAEQVAVREE
jgi:hypothetical protein